MNKRGDNYDSVKSSSNDPTTVKRSKRSTVRLALRAERAKLKELGADPDDPSYGEIPKK